MEYKQTLDFLFNRLQSFHNKGATAYKPGLEKALKLSESFGNPHEKFKAIHVGGTNGKGSTAHSLASVLMASGMKVGLYTSPHLVDFAERIRINGAKIAHSDVTDFVERFLAMDLSALEPSFFELTTIMAFDFFARNNVDIAVIEVGLGGRLDTTNIINPIFSVITNVSYDHTELLGKTLPEIAREKAGIIKPGVPAVIGRRNDETDGVFAFAGHEVVFAPDKPLFVSAKPSGDVMTYFGTPWGDVGSCLTGDCQIENMQTILTSLKVLQDAYNMNFDDKDVIKGLRNVCADTGLMGRWMKLSERPLVIADTGHNVDGWHFISQRLKGYNGSRLHIVLGFVKDKDYNAILKMLPTDASYYFVQPSVERGASSNDLAAKAFETGLKGEAYVTVSDGFKAALFQARQEENAIVFVGGSTFVVADLLATIKHIL